MEDSFVREIALEKFNKTLKLYQQTVGDVGCVVWDAAIVLSRYLETASHMMKLKGKTVVELGAGVGCVGLTASCFGANVIMTDLPEILPLLEKNINANKIICQSTGGKVEARPLKWSCEFANEDRIEADFILMADCVYYSESINDLISTLITLSSDNTQLIICQEERESEKQKDVWNSFLKLFEESFTYHRVPENEQHPLYHSPDICILRALKKAIK